jgi:ABC-type multidrug transport system fused ATPase/permease subunit
VRVKVAASLAAMSEAIAGLPTIRAYGAEERTLQRVDGRSTSSTAPSSAPAPSGAVMFSSAELFAASVTAGVVVAGILLGDTGLTAGQLVAFLFLVALFIDPVQLLVEVLNEAQTAASGVRRVLSVLETPADVADPPDGRDLPPGPLSVTFRDVRFRYPTGEEVLHGLDLHLDAGARVAVVGETGSGKSTFVKLLTRLIDPTSGTIELSGVPLQQVRFASLRDRVVFVPQDGFLFDASLADNVRYGAPDASDGQVLEALAALGLEPWVASLPAGVRSPVGPARVAPVRRGTAARCGGARLARRSRPPRARRGHLGGGPGPRGAAAPSDRAADRRPDEHHRRAPTGHRGGRGRGAGAARRAPRRARPARGAGRGGWGVRRPARRLGAQQRRPQGLTTSGGPGRTRQD